MWKLQKQKDEKDYIFQSLNDEILHLNKEWKETRKNVLIFINTHLLLIIYPYK